MAGTVLALAGKVVLLLQLSLAIFGQRQSLDVADGQLGTKQLAEFVCWCRSASLCLV